MKIQLYQKDKLCCHITREDLRIRNIKINDYAKNTEAAKRLFHEIMEQAAIQYNFNADDIPLKFEAIPIDTDHITLIISKEQNAKIINFQEWKKKALTNNTGQHVVENITKLNDKQITVFIPEYDMKCYSLTFQDFIQKKRKAFDFIVDVLEQSFFDCGFYRIPENHRYSIHTNIKDKKGVSITITAKQNVDVPEDTIITMKDWTSTCDIPERDLI